MGNKVNLLFLLNKNNNRIPNFKLAITEMTCKFFFVQKTIVNLPPPAPVTIATLPSKRTSDIADLCLTRA